MNIVDCANHIRARCRLLAEGEQIVVFANVYTGDITVLATGTALAAQREADAVIYIKVGTYGPATRHLPILQDLLAADDERDRRRHAHAVVRHVQGVAA